jgi:ketosteroid isomerase-like protein
MSNSDALALAERLFATIEAGDIDTVRELYAPGARIWHNHDGVVQTPEENLRLLGWIVRNITQLRYEDIIRQPTPAGFVQQHVLRGVNAKGEPIELPAAIICQVSDGKITRLDEYLDSGQIAALLS